MLKAGVFLRPGVFFVFLLAAFGGLRADTGAAGTILRQAWEEYEYGEFAKASGLFSQALNGPGVSEKDQCQALVGLAFCSQFGKKSQVSASDYEEALRLYDRALPLALKTNDSKCAALVKSMSAECNFRLWQLDDDKKRLESANSLWDTVQKEYPCSIIAQDALLCETVLKTDSYLDDSSVENAKKLESYMKRHSNPVVMGKKDLKSMSPEERENVVLRGGHLFLPRGQQKGSSVV
jgi:tetratricopeptide (TPR) repeat protein